MKMIRYIASILLLTAGVLHFFLFIQEPGTAGSAVVLLFGIIYFVIGIILFLNIKYSTIAGVIFPLIGIIAGLTMFDPAEVNPLLKILGITEVMIIIFCSILAWGSRKKVN